MPFYKKGWFMWLMMFVFFPVGLILLWTQSGYSQKSKSIITVVWLGLIVVGGIFGNNHDANVQTVAVETSKQKIESESAKKEKYQEAYNQFFKEISTIDDVANKQWQTLWVDTMNGLGNGIISPVEAYKKTEQARQAMYDISTKIHKVDVPSVFPSEQRDKMEKGKDKLIEAFNMQAYSANKMKDGLGDGQVTPKGTSKFQRFVQIIFIN